MSAQKSAGSNDVSKSTLTAEDYKRIRSLFANSRYGDIRVAGTHFVDVVWQASGPGDDTGAALMFIVPLVSAYADLAGACTNHGVELPRMTAA